MKTAVIITIGDEILKGKIDDTNATFISRWLHGLGLATERRVTVGDSIDDIADALMHSSEAGLVILTGGLGPTDDDVTREGFAKFLGEKLQFNEDAWSKIGKFFKSRDLPIAESNRKQAMTIEGAEILPNDNGTAPGIFYDAGKTIYAVLPGPPRENRDMIENSLFKKLKERDLLTQDITTKIIRVYNTGESAIADILKDYRPGCGIGYYFSQEGYVEIHIIRAGLDRKQNLKDVDDCYMEITKRLSANNIDFTENRAQSLILLEFLKSKKLTLSFAESITGGNLAGEFVKNAGASDALAGGVVVYSNESKIKLLGVKEDTIVSHGAVSEQTVKEMTIGLKKLFNTDVCVSVSGIAGPSGATDKKPVGLVHFAFMFNDELITRKEVFFGSRERIIKRTVNYCYLEILKFYKAV